jgi:hypothetical protein
MDLTSNIAKCHRMTPPPAPAIMADIPELAAGIQNGSQAQFCGYYTAPSLG